MTIVTSTLLGSLSVPISVEWVKWTSSQFWHMQVGTVFFDAPYGKIITTAGETHQDPCKVIYSVVGSPPGTYSKRIAIGPVAKKLSQI